MKTSHYTRFDRWVARLRHDKAIRHIVPNSRVCDLGCGVDALFLQTLTAVVDEAVGLDYQEVSTAVPGARFVRSDVTKDLPLDSDAFDHVTLLAILEHLEDPEPLMAESFRVLSPGGSLIITYPAAIVDPLLHLLMAIGVVSRSTEVDRHKPRKPSSHWCRVLAEIGFFPVIHQRFELGLNHLIVAHKPPA